MINQEAGRVAEEKALDYLRQHGLQLIKRNYSCRVGEIDIIMRDGDYYVFIEVRSRSGNSFGGGVTSITASKKTKIMKATSYYMMTQKLYEKFPLRFDVVSIDGISNELTWIKDAFGLDY